MQVALVRAGKNELDTAQLNSALYDVASACGYPEHISYCAALSKNPSAVLEKLEKQGSST